MRLLLPLVLFSLSGCVIHVYPASGGGPSRHSDPEVQQVMRGIAERERALRRENLEALTNTAVRIASDVQAWARKPRAFGGGNGRFEGVTFEQMGYESDHVGRFLSMDGAFSLEVGEGAFCVIGTATSSDNRVVVHVNGFGPGDISTTTGSVNSHTTLDAVRTCR